MNSFERSDLIRVRGSRDAEGYLERREQILKRFRERHKERRNRLMERGIYE